MVTLKLTHYTERNRDVVTIHRARMGWSII
jgi:hypothetical protein